MSILGILGPGPAFSQAVISTAAGGGPEDLPATAANLSRPVSVALTPTAELLILDAGRGSLFLVDSGGSLRRVLGSGGLCQTIPYGDGLPASRACTLEPRGMAVDAAGNIYFSDGRSAVRRIDKASGLVSRVAGTYVEGYGVGDGVPATSARLNAPHGLAFDLGGNLLIADRLNHRVRRIDSHTQIISSIAGTGQPDYTGDGNPGAVAGLNEPFGVAVDATGNIFVADMGNHRIRRIDAVTGIITTYAGNGVSAALGDGGPAGQASLVGPAGLAFDANGNLLLAEWNDVGPPPPPGDDQDGHRIRRIEHATGIITTIAGGNGPYFDGDGGPALAGSLSRPAGITTSASGDLFIADQGNRRVRRVDAATSTVTTAAGNGEATFSGDGFAARGAGLGDVADVVFEGTGGLLIADRLNGRLRRVDTTTGIITTVAGSGLRLTSGDGGPALNAGIECVYGLAKDGAGDILIADPCANRIRRVGSITGTITTVAGTGQRGYGGDGGPATSALLNQPDAVTIGPSGDLYIVDSVNHRIRRVSPTTGIITTVAGTGVQTGSIDGEGGDPSDDLGDGKVARNASLGDPADAVFDGSGNLIISDLENGRVRRISANTGVISTIAGNGTWSFGGDGGPATEAALAPANVALDASGNLFVADALNHRLRRVDAATAIITTLAGDGSAGPSQDGAAARSTGLSGPIHLALDPSGRIYFSDPVYGRVHVVLAESPPSGAIPESAPLTVVPAGGGDLSLSWGASCVPEDSDYAIYEGLLGQYDSHEAIVCSTSGATAKTFTPTAGNRYYLVVPRSGTREGSYGLRSDGTQRSQGSPACAPQAVGASCP